MKKRIINIIITSAFLIQIFGMSLIFIVQKKEAFSETENRLLADLPSISFDGYISGGLTKEIETYVSDHFPFKYRYVEFSRKINSLYYFGGFRKEDDIVILAAVTGTAPVGGIDDSIKPEDGTKEQSTVETESVPPPEEEAVNTGGLLIVKDKLMESFTFSEAAVKKYTDSVNQLYNECGKPETYVMVPTSAAQLYLPDKYRNDTNDQYTAFDLLKSRLDGPTYIDLRDTFEAHKSEYLYFNTDHHWTALGAYYAYEALADTLGMKAPKLSEYKSGKREGFRGGLYTSLAKYPQYESFKNVFDEVYYYYPKNSAEVYSYARADFSNGTERKMIEPEYDKNTNLYNTFFGGDIPVGYMHSEIGNGKSILVVRDSYGHAFLPYLADSFEHIYSVEPRYFSKDSNPLVLSKIFKEKNIDVLLFINYSLTATSGYWMSWGTELQRITE